uniref:(California timema) hypothetical protein n=1 Tax=Timema californicum TaxID=61474 RepID=A0A7R9PAE5_TIMCA|nr:unnamed protein product [Timema californicum]
MQLILRKNSLSIANCGTSSKSNHASFAKSCDDDNGSSSSPVDDSDCDLKFKDFLVSGVHLQVCPQELTCCTEEMEHQLSSQSRQEYDKVVKETLGKMGSLLRTRAHKFDGEYFFY